MTAVAQANGHVAPAENEREAFEHAVAAQVESMRTLLAEQRSITRQLAAELDEQKGREKRIEKALAALQGETSASAARPKPQPPSARKRYASEEAVAKVLAALEAAGGDQRQSELCEATGLSTPTVSQSLAVLREREQVRITRVENQSKFYAPMPGATDGA